MEQAGADGTLPKAAFGLPPASSWIMSWVRAGGAGRWGRWGRWVGWLGATPSRSHALSRPLTPKKARRCGRPSNQGRHGVDALSLPPSPAHQTRPVLAGLESWEPWKASTK